MLPLPGMAMRDAKWWDATVALVRLSINPPTGMQTACPIRAAA